MSLSNPHALAKAQDDDEVFEVMQSPPSNFDIFSDKPLTLGTKKARRLVHRDQDWHRSVHVWIVDKKRRLVAMQKRSSLKDTFPGRWDISAAGHIEHGHDSKETAVREVAEELGIDCSLEELDFGFTIPAQQADLGGCNCYEDVYFIIRNAETCHFAIGEAEVSAMKWISVDELKQLLENEACVPRPDNYKIAFFEKLESMCCNSNSHPSS